MENFKALAADKTIVIKALDKGSSVVVWDRSDYLQEAFRQLQDKNVYEDVRFRENILIDLVERSNNIFKSLFSHKLISEKELKYFTSYFKGNQSRKIILSAKNTQAFKCCSRKASYFKLWNAHREGLQVFRSYS